MPFAPREGRGIRRRSDRLIHDGVADAIRRDAPSVHRVAVSVRRCEAERGRGKKTVMHGHVPAA